MAVDATVALLPVAITAVLQLVIHVHVAHVKFASMFLALVFWTDSVALEIVVADATAVATMVVPVAQLSVQVADVQVQLVQ
jgi:hypothetical protein